MRNKAFSLIEIVQTIVLLGIIAGLAVSFFKNFRPNDKLYFKTQTSLELAIQQAKKDICSDNSPAYENGNDVTLCSTSCNNIIAGSTYNSNTGYCEIAANADYACTSGTAKDTDLDGNTDLCYASPTHNGTAAGTPCQPVKEFYCQSGSVDFSSANRQTITTASSIKVALLCYYLHKNLNHKTQATSATDTDTDLTRTCNANNDWPTAFTKDTKLNEAGINDSSTGVGHVSNDASLSPRRYDHYSMLLPNGVRLYNLGHEIAADGTQKIFVKYDGLDDIDTSYLDTTNNGEANIVANIKNSTVWCIKVTKTGSVSNCKLGD